MQWLSFLFASCNSALIVFLTEIMPADIRTAGFSLVHSSATAIFGGFTPASRTPQKRLRGCRAHAVAHTDGALELGSGRRPEM